MQLLPKMGSRKMAKLCKEAIEEREYFSRTYKYVNVLLFTVALVTISYFLTKAGIAIFRLRNADVLIERAVIFALPLGVILGIFLNRQCACTVIGKKYAVIEAERLKREQQAKLEAAAQPKTRQGGFAGMMLGTSTGWLYEREHRAACKAGITVSLDSPACCQNIISFGGIGSGKTTRFINNALQQILSQDCSALVFDIKGDFRRELDFIARQVGRSYKVVGDGGMTLNLFRGCTPEVAASYLKSCFIASGSASGSGAFWTDTATNYCRNLLQLLQLTDGDYSITGLAELVFSDRRRSEAMAELKDRIDALDRREQRLAEACLSFLLDSVDKWDDKFKGSVLGTCEPVLNPFMHPDLVDAFSVPATDGEANLRDLIDKGAIFLVNLPRSKFGTQGARFAYLLIKLRFMSMMSERRSHPEWNQDRHVSFFCDEYQTIADSISDTDFWDKSRSSRTIGVVSMQGVSSLIQAVGDPKTADAVLQNFRQRIVFRTEDQATIQMCQQLLGKVDVIIENTNVGSSYSEGSSHGGTGSQSTSSQTSTWTDSSGVSHNLQQQQLIDANDFRALDTNLALCLCNVGDRALDEIVTFTPLFVPENYFPSGGQQ